MDANNPELLESLARLGPAFSSVANCLASASDSLAVAAQTLAEASQSISEMSHTMNRTSNASPARTCIQEGGADHDVLDISDSESESENEVEQTNTVGTQMELINCEIFKRLISILTVFRC